MRSFIFVVSVLANMTLWYLYLGVQEAVVGGALLCAAALGMLLGGRGLK